MSKLEKNVLLLGYISTATGGALVGRILAETFDYRLLIAYFLGGLGGVILGASKS